MKDYQVMMFNPNHPDESFPISPVDLSKTVLPVHIKVGDTITDGSKTYILGKDHRFHYCDSSNHGDVEVEVGKEDLKKIIEAVNGN